MAEMEIVLIWILTILIPINGALWLGIRNERMRNARIVREIWRLRGSQRSRRGL